MRATPVPPLADDCISGMRPVLPRVSVLLALLALLLAAPPRAAAQGVALRDVDWRAALAATPGVQLDPTCPSGVPFAPPGAVCIVLSGVDGIGGGGYANVERVLYGDLDGDGREEAVLPVESGGTAGTVAFLVYQQAAPWPRLVARHTGYKLGLQLDGGALLVYEPYYFGFEGNCCPTALQRTPYTLGPNGLVAGDTVWVAAFDERRALTVAEVVVRGFYHALDGGALPEAYAFLSPRFQAASPYAPWAAGYARTGAIEVETRPGPGVDAVALTLAVRDREAPPDAPPAERFSGTWQLTPSPGAPLGLLLDRADIAAVR